LTATAGDRNMVSIVSDSSLVYSSGEEFYGPDQVFPEYSGRPNMEVGAVSKAPNPVYAAVRELFQMARLDCERFGGTDWNPLQAYVKPGSTVFLLCNFVSHQNVGESLHEFYAKCTHASVIRPIIDYVLLAQGDAGRVYFGNAPLQSCRWEKVLEASGATRMLQYYERVFPGRVEAIDLRSRVAERGLSGAIVREVQLNSEIVKVDLGEDSLLAGLKTEGSLFRVHDYDARATESHHRGRQHIYVMNKALLNASVVISVPKLKTHEKVGITCALKGFVGAVADKACLAHHRFGPPNAGGDEYPSGSTVRIAMSRFHDWVQGGGDLLGLGRVIDTLYRRVLKRFRMIQGGAWHGNDTAWRMTLDLARILMYSDRSGRMLETPCRSHLMLIDGIVAGEGDGPLRPSPRHAGILLYSDDLVMGDWCASALMGFDASRIPLLQMATVQHKYSLVPEWDQSIILNGVVSELEQLSPQAAWQGPRGWIGHLERSR
jgi:uncharacterized protein (DUF362 family)